MNTEQDIIDQAIIALQEATDLLVDWIPATDSTLDGYVNLVTNFGTIRLQTEVKRRANAHQIDQLIWKREKLGETLLLAEIIPNDLKKVLRHLKLNYLDVAGNCFIQSKGQLIFIEGRKSAKVNLAGKQPFGKSGLRVIFTLLTQPDAINITVRELADKTGVSIGTVQQTLDSLKRLGYIIPLDAQSRRLIQIEKLQEQWINRYPNTLKPNLLIGRFRLPKGIKPADWKQITLKPGSYWSSEPAADALTANLRPEILTIYTREDTSALIHHYRLLPDRIGQVEVNKLFWQPKGDSSFGVSIAPPLLVYADLLASTDLRNIEIARTIYQQYVQNKI